MKWQNLGTFTVSNDWQYTKRITSQEFSIAYLSSPLQINSSSALVALANLPSSGNESTQFFKPQRINAYLPSEIVIFPTPPKGWEYRLAFRKLILPKQLIPDFTIQIFMPVVDLTPDQPPVNPTIATTKNPIAVSIAGNSTAPIKLLPTSANNNRKHATFYNPSTKRNLYIDTDATINAASAIAKVAPGKIYVSDIPGWQGEYWGMMDSSDTVATAIAVEEYV